MKFENIRKQLEVKHTHVTFVKVVGEGKTFEYTVWTVGEDMEEVTVSSQWAAGEILVNLEMKKVAETANVHCDKYFLFKQAMIQGLVAVDYKLYNKTTEKKLRVLLGY